MLSIKQTFLSNFVSAYRKHYSANHVIISLMEKWKKKLDKNKIVGAVFMDLSKAFNFIPHDLLIASQNWKPMDSVRAFLLFSIHI